MPAPRLLRPLILIAVLGALVVVLIALPASLVKRFLPPPVEAQEFSGTLWHGSAANVIVGGRSVGAVEWRLHPWSLVEFTLAADLHWVKVGFVADGRIDISSRSLTLRDVQGGGPIEDLREFGIPEGWRGTATIKIREFKALLANGAGSGPSWAAAVGDLEVFNLAARQVAGGADLGGFALHLANSAITPGADATAELADTGGPLEVQATIHFASGGRTGMLSGTVKARPDAPAGLISALESLAQLHPADRRGAIPVDLEFTL